MSDRDRYAAQHQALDELVTAFVSATGRMPSEATVVELMRWSFLRLQEADKHH